MPNAVSNQIQNVYIAETVAGVTPTTGNFQEFILSTGGPGADPQMKEDPSINPTGQPSGQVVTSIDVKGSVSAVLKTDVSHYDFMSYALRDVWSSTCTTGALALTIVPGTSTITRAAGSFITDGFKVNDMVQLSNFVNAANNTVLVLLTVTALNVTYAVNTNMVAEVGPATTTMVRPNFCEWKANDKTFTWIKNFKDQTNKSITYTRCTVGKAAVDMKFGDYANVSFDIEGCGVDYPATPVTQGRTITAIDPALNGLMATDMGIMLVNGVDPGFCVDSFKLSIDNNVKSVECINNGGKKTAAANVATSLKVDVELSAFLNDSSFALIKDKLNQVTYDVITYVKNSSGGFGFRIPSVQLVFPDPDAKGNGELVKLDGKGMAKYNAAMGNTIRVYKLV